MEARRREEQSRREAEEQRRIAEEERFEFERRLEEQAIEARRQEEEAAEARRREEQSRREAEEQQRKAEEERIALQQHIDETEEKLSKGIKPVVWPTQEEVDKAKARIQYDSERLHFAVCGPSGSGKSSLINSFRGLKKGEPGAADVGTVETTLEVTRYPDPRTELPYPRFVWCDVPGAGTFNIPSWQYFNQQGLFIFDFIVLVYDNRFTQIDADILGNCRRFKIPALIVRSKATQQIRNMMDDDDCLYEDARDKYIKLTQDNLRTNLQEAGLWKPGQGEPPRCYIVSRECVYDYIHSTEEDRWEKRMRTKIPKEEKKGGKLTHQYIDEVQLIHDLLQTAYERRYISKPEKNRTAAMMSSVTMAASKLGINVPIHRT
ncbi:interferon-inducible GTPase-domain-containing protein [Trichophaea hybrida]|nr:interferon-inducible GTPase-domain-containing protein [Trichophaea hybrida]